MLLLKKSIKDVFDFELLSEIDDFFNALIPEYSSSRRSSLKAFETPRIFQIEFLGSYLRRGLI